MAVSWAPHTFFEVVVWAGFILLLLVVDAAVPAGVMQQLTDMVLSHGFSCGFSGIPNHE